MMKKNKYGYDVFAGDALYSIDCTGDACIGDEVRFSRAIWSGSYPKAKFVENIVMDARIINDSYGQHDQQHTFTLQDENGKILLIKGRNLYENGLWRKPWANENVRLTVLKNKHDRGREARQIKSYNTMTRGERIEYKQKDIMTPENIPQEQKFNPLIKDPGEVLRYACKGCGEMKAGSEYVWRRPNGTPNPIRDPYCKKPCRASFLQKGLKRAVKARREEEAASGFSLAPRPSEQQDFVSKLRHIKEVKGLRRQDMANMFGVTMKSISNWLLKGVRPQPQYRPAILSAYEDVKHLALPAPAPIINIAHKSIPSPAQPETPPTNTQPETLPAQKPPAQPPANAGPSGWRCPSCRRVWAPHVDACKDC